MGRQTSVDSYGTKATAGMRSSNANCFIDTKVNGSVKKDTVSVTSPNLATTATVNGTAYTYDAKTVSITAADTLTTVTVNGTAYTVNSAGGTLSKTDTSTALAAAINAGETLSTAAVVGETCVVTSVVTAQTVVGTANASVAQTSKTTTQIAAGLTSIVNANESGVTASSALGVMTLVSDEVGTSYTVVGTTNCTVAIVNANASAIGFGLFVCADSNDEDMAKLPATATDVTGRVALGFSEFTQTRENTDEGWKINADINYVRRGTIWAVAEEEMAISDTVYIRHTANGVGYTTLGTVRSDADSSTASALDGCSVLQYDSNTGLVELDVNLPA